jgi:hypothetical protein
MSLFPTLLFQRPELSNFDMPLAERRLSREKVLYERKLGCDQWRSPAVCLVRGEHHEIRNSGDAMVHKLLVYLGVKGEVECLS